MMRKFKINWKTVTRNVMILLNIAVVAVLIYTFKTKGIEFFSTIRIFRIRRFIMKGTIECTKKDLQQIRINKLNDDLLYLQMEINSNLDLNKLIIDEMIETLQKLKGE